MEFDCPMAAEYYENTYTLSDKIGKIIKREDILRLYLSDADFRDIIKTEQYCYTTEGVIVLNHPKYVSKTDGVLHVTDYALQHKEECIISLQTQSVSRTEDSKNLLFRRADRPSVLFTKSDFLANSEDNGSEKKELIYNKDPIQNFTTSGAALFYYINKAGWNAPTFASRTDIGAARYTDFKKEYEAVTQHKKIVKHKNYALDSLISTGFALGLSVFQMEKILNMSNYTIIPDSMQNWAYRFCFELCQDLPIGDCNNMLRNVGLKGLNNKTDQT